MRPLHAVARLRSPKGVAVVAALLSGLAGLAAVSPAYGAADAAADPTARQVRSVDVARHSPYAGRHCNVATPYYTSPGGKEGEPFVAVDPRRPRHRIVAWMDATRATVDVAYTSDGGRSWRRSVPRGIDGCTGDHEKPWEASGDVWISIGPDGTAYLSTLTWAHFVTPPASGYTSVVHVQVSHDGGRSWSAPVFLAGHDAVSDKPMVVADPYHAGVAYELWRNQGFGMPVGPRGRTRLLVAATHDAGRTWTRPVPVARGARSDFFGSPQLSVLRNGTLVATSSLGNASGGTDLLSWRSGDGGRTWRGPTAIRGAGAGESPSLCGQSPAGGDTGSSAGQQAVLHGRSVLLVSLDAAAAEAGRGRLLLSRSDDAGRTWRTRAVMRSREPLLLASLSADRHGRLGLVWDRVATGDVDCAAARVPTQTRFAASATGGSSWSRPVAVGARWWNLAASIRGSGGFSGYFVGDYQAVAATPGGFTTVTVQGPALTAGAPRIHGATGVVVSDVRVRAGPA
jgi:hypothetical protein